MTSAELKHRVKLQEWGPVKNYAQNYLQVLAE